MHMAIYLRRNNEYSDWQIINMKTQNVILKKGGVSTKIFVSKQQFIVY